MTPVFNVETLTKIPKHAQNLNEQVDPVVILTSGALLYKLETLTKLDCMNSSICQGKSQDECDEEADGSYDDFYD